MLLILNIADRGLTCRLFIVTALNIFSEVKDVLIMGNQVFMFAILEAVHVCCRIVYIA